MGYVAASQQPSDPQHMGTAFNPAKTSPASWDAFSDVDAFVDAVLAELAAMAADGTRPTRSGPKPPLTGAALRKAIMAIWCVCVLRHAVARDRPALRHPVRHAVHAVRPPARAVAPPAQPLDPGLAAGLRRYSRTQRRHPRQPLLSFSADLLRPRLRWRQEDQGHQIHLAVDKYGFPLAINVSPANIHDSKGIVPVLHQLAGRGFKGTALGDLSYRGQRLSKAGEALGITLQPSAGGHGGTFIPEGIRWVVERSLAWISRYRRLNTIFERTGGTSSLSSRSPSSRSCPAAWSAL